MIYNCPLCGEIKTQDVQITCQVCGSEVEERGNDDFFCPNCGEQNPDELNFECKICGSNEVTI